MNNRVGGAKIAEYLWEVGGEVKYKRLKSMVCSSEPTCIFHFFNLMYFLHFLQGAG